MLFRLIVLAFLTVPATAQCPTSAPGFGAPGTTAPVVDFATFDDGNGPALFVCGDFAGAGDALVSGLARWDASGWSAPVPGPELASGRIERLRVLDLGAGPRLIALGDFGLVAGQPARGVASFDGQSWDALAGGPPVTAPFTGLTLRAAVVYDEGQGPRLFVGGFVVEDDYPSSRKPYLARWDGASWTQITDGPQDFESCGIECLPNGAISALEVLDEPGGPALYAAGSFRLLGPPVTWNLARWDGTSWSAPGGVGIGGSSNGIAETAIHDDGTGAALYLLGSFGTSAPHPNLVRWNGQSYDAPVQGLVGPVDHVRSLPAAGGHPAALWAMPNRPPATTQMLALQRWNGTQWIEQPVHIEYYGETYALGAFDAGNGDLLFLGGAFHGAGGQAAANLVAFDGSAWSPLASGLGWTSDSGSPGFVSALAIHDDGNGPALYCGGEFVFSNGTEFADLARWNGTAWQPIPGIVLPTLHHVEDLLSLDIGNGPELWVGGDLKLSGLNPMAVARWDGNTSIR